MTVITAFERHGQTIVQFLIAALLIWVGHSTVTLRETAIRLELRQEQSSKDTSDMRIELGVLRTQVSNAATAATVAATAATTAAATASTVAAAAAAANSKR